MQQFQSRYSLLPGSSYDEVVARARKEFNTIRRITKRQPYVRSKYFRGDKIFVMIFDAKNLDIMLHRFYGKTKDGYEFCVQVKEDKRSGRKDFMSVFDRKLR